MPPSIGRFWLACALSLCLHGSLGFWLFHSPFHGTHSGGGPVGVGAVTFDLPDEPLPLTVLPNPPQPPNELPATIAQAAAPLVKTTALTTSERPSEGPAVAANLEQRSTRGVPAEAVVPAFFQVPVQGQSVVYVLDRSLSMGGVRLRNVKRELLASLSRLPPTSRFQIIFYNGQASTLRLADSTSLAAANDDNKRLATEQIEVLAAEGGTRHLPALQLALSLEPDVIYFLTDAGDVTPGLVREVTKLNRRRCIIHTFELSSAGGDADLPLKTLARQNRGEYRALAVR